MNLLAVLSGALTTVLVAIIGYFGARLVQRATAKKLNADAGLSEATADKTAVDGYDLLTGRLEARLTASEKRETELLERLDRAEETIRDLRAQVTRLTRRLADVESDEGADHA